MQIQIPANLVFKAKSPDVKMALILEFPIESGGCENCGGTGFIALFLATNGPFESPGTLGKFVSKFHDGKWWCAPSGNADFGTVSAPCPVCGGIKQPRTIIPTVPAQRPIKQLAERMTK